jgi:flagellar protein FlaG
VGQVEQTQSAEQMQEAQRQEIQQAVRQMNDYVQNIQRDISFSVDEDTGRTIISVKDSQSGELIRQIPREEILDMAKSLKEAQGLLFKARV